MNSLRRRLKQQEKKDSDEYKIAAKKKDGEEYRTECIHEPSFDWGDAYRAIDLQ